MTARRSCPAAPGALEGYAARFDDLFGRLAQRRGFRGDLSGLLAPRGRNKTLTALAGAGAGARAPAPGGPRLEVFWASPGVSVSGILVYLRSGVPLAGFF